MYIGQTIGNFNKRRQKHFCDARKNRDYIFGRALIKYGEENFDWSILSIENDKKSLDDTERYWIKFIETTNRKFGYNLKEGGSKGRRAEETKKKISKTMKGRKLSEKQMKSLLKGVRNRKNVILMQGHKIKISEGLKRKWQDPEYRKNVSRGLTGKKRKPFTEEHKRNLSEAIRRAYKGRTFSEEHCKKISEALKGRIKTEEERKNISKARKRYLSGLTKK